MTDETRYFIGGMALVAVVIVALSLGPTWAIFGGAWWVCWRPGLVDWIQGRRYLRQSRIQLAEIKYLEEIFKEK